VKDSFALSFVSWHLVWYILMGIICLAYDTLGRLLITCV